MKTYIIEASYYSRVYNKNKTEVFNNHTYDSFAIARSIAERWVHRNKSVCYYEYLIYEIDTDEGVCNPVNYTEWKAELSNRIGIEERMFNRENLFD